MAKYQQYEEYKDSGIEWLGKIPSHWGIQPLKYLLLLIKNGATTTQVDETDKTVPISRIETISTGEINTSKVGYINPNAISESYKLDKGDILFSHINSLSMIGNLALKRDETTLFHGMNLLRLKVDASKINEEYFFWLLKSKNLRQVFEANAKPAINQASLSTNSIKNIYLNIPGEDEQTKIANFLHYETAQIDTLIEKQQNLIQLLKEKRQAVISHAVTKGLNSDAPMKDSGVEWLGEVPEHWEQVELKHVVDYIIDAEHKTAPYFEQGKYLVCRTTNVRDGELRLEGGKYTNEETYLEWIKRGKPEIGDILFTREAPAGEACVYDGTVPLCLGQRMVLFKLKKDRVLPTFVLHSLYSGLADDFIKQLSQGSTVAHFNMADIRNIPLFEPSLVEQQEIVEYLSKLLNKFDDLVYSAEKAIQLMQERRTALISAAVTGKIDVRGWQAPE